MTKTKIIVLRILAILAIVEILILVFAGFQQISGTKELFESFEGPLPLITTVYLVTYKYWILLAIFPLFIFVKSFREKFKSRNSSSPFVSLLIAFIIIGILIFVGIIFAMYAPIWELSNKA